MYTPKELWGRMGSTHYSEVPFNYPDTRRYMVVMPPLVQRPVLSIPLQHYQLIVQHDSGYTIYSPNLDEGTD
jgi:hypothetical protein